MKRAVFAVALGLGLIAFVGPTRSYAFGDEQLTVHVPFAFHVRDALLPAGDYRIQRADPLNSQVLEIASRTRPRNTFVMTANAQPPHTIRRPELVFDRYAGQEFLHAIWVPDGMGAVVEASDAERNAVETTAPAPAKAKPASTPVQR